MTIYLDFVSYAAHYIISFYYFALSPVFCVWPKHVISLYLTNARTFRIMDEEKKTHIYRRAYHHAEFAALVFLKTTLSTDFQITLLP